MIEIGNLSPKSDDKFVRKILKFVTRVSLLGTKISLQFEINFAIETYRSQIFKGGKMKHFAKLLLLSKDYETRNRTLLVLANLVLDGMRNF